MDYDYKVSEFIYEYDGSKWNNGFGEFEKHTKGVGMEILMRMGYRGEGHGLGKDEHGIRAPIQIEQWPHKMGIGFNNFIYKHKDEEEDEEEAARPPPSSSGRKDKQQQQQLWSKKKAAYVTAEEVLAQKKEGFEIVHKVLDMRGPQVRLLTNLKNLNDVIPMPELQHNIQLIVDIVEHDKDKLDANLRNERETVAALHKEKEKLQMEAHHQKQQLRNMEEMITVFDQITLKHTESLAQSFLDLQKRFPDEYTLCNVSCIACSYALPIFISDNPPDYLTLSPWKTVFDPARWEQLMVRYIIPKLLIAMHELDINIPANQNDLDRLNWVRTWVTAIPPHHMLQLMDIFFNKWQQVLYHWLYSNPDFEQVSRWFLGWKELLIPPEVEANEHVRRRLFLGLQMMEQAVQGMEVAPPPPASFKKKAAAQPQHRALVNEIPSLKEVAETHAQQNGLLFKPKPGRMQDGHQIYGFGNISIIIDSFNQKIYAQTEDRRWTFVSLDHLLELQNHRSKMKRRH